MPPRCVFTQWYRATFSLNVSAASVDPFGNLVGTVPTSVDAWGRSDQAACAALFIVR